MIARCALYETGQVDPYANLAREECLLEAVEPGQAILYLWQNEHTVVIGRNQNAFDECDVAALEAEGGMLARRLSGGGAVYHDLGNLNFTFLIPTADWNLDAQTEVLMRALASLGIRAEQDGRNDLSIGGRKFSGHAYYHRGGKSFHHGTLMVHVDPERLSRYLTASPLKLGSKGVASVRSRVMNLADAAPGLSIGDLKAALAQAFSSVFGMRAEPLAEDLIAADGLARTAERYRSRAWILRDARTFGTTRQARFAWGTVRLDYTAEQGMICDAALYSDGLEADAIEAIPAALAGCALDRALVRKHLAALGVPGEMARDLASLLA